MKPFLLYVLVLFSINSFAQSKQFIATTSACLSEREHDGGYLATCTLRQHDQLIIEDEDDHVIKRYIIKGERFQSKLEVYAWEDGNYYVDVDIQIEGRRKTWTSFIFDPTNDQPLGKHGLHYQIPNSNRSVSVYFKVLEK